MEGTFYMALLEFEGKIFPAIFTEDDVDEYKDALSFNFYIYYIRHSDFDDTLPRTIEKKVIVNRYGTLLLDMELKLPIHPVPDGVNVKEDRYLDLQVDGTLLINYDKTVDISKFCKEKKYYD